MRSSPIVRTIDSGQLSTYINYHKISNFYLVFCVLCNGEWTRVEDKLEWLFRIFKKHCHQKVEKVNSNFRDPACDLYKVRALDPL